MEKTGDDVSPNVSLTRDEPRTKSLSSVSLQLGPDFISVQFTVF